MKKNEFHEADYVVMRLRRPSASYKMPKGRLGVVRVVAKPFTTRGSYTVRVVDTGAVIQVRWPSEFLRFATDEEVQHAQDHFHGKAPPLKIDA